MFGLALAHSPPMVGSAAFIPQACGPETSWAAGLQYPQLMSASFESVLVSVWQQALVDKKEVLEIDGETYSVRQTAKSKLKQIDFRFEGRELRGLQQNPNTKSRWAKLAREGKQVMQFLEGGRYIAVVVDGKIHIYK
jgi:hypothetical protein